MTNMIPQVEWTPCRIELPTEGKFVWIVVGREYRSGAARRYEREVHMGVYNGECFQIFPYSTPIISNEVWAWAKIVAPAPPIVTLTKKNGGNDYGDNYGPDEFPGSYGL